MTTPHPADDWSWARQERPAELEPQGASAVTLVLVAHNGDQWLGRGLIAIARLAQRPGRIIAIDTGSTDGTVPLLQKALNEELIDHLVLADQVPSFGAAVDLALAEHPLDPNGWLWLLHDDAEPRRTALTGLLRAASAPGAADILLPKLLHPRLRNHPDHVGEAGESISVTGARVFIVDPGDLDQRQLEAVDVLGGSTAGMLIRASAWHRLDGLDQALPIFRDGVDLGWRANEAGLRVRTCPEAAIYHHKAGHGGLRDSILTESPEADDRLAGMRMVAAHSARPDRVTLGLQGNSLLRAAGMLLGKSPSRARAEWAALRKFRQTRDVTADFADRVRASNPQPLPEGLRPTAGWGWRRAAELLAGGVEDRYRDFRAEPDTTLDDLTGDDFSGSHGLQRWWRPGRIVAMALLMVSLVAAWPTFGVGHLVGPRFLGAPETLGQAWSAWLSPEPGLAGSNASWLGLAAIGSTVLAGQPDLFATLIFLGGVGMACWSAHRLLRRITNRTWLNLGLALLWGLLIPVTGALTDGQLDAVLVAMVFPLLLLAAHHWSSESTTGGIGLRAPGAVALWVTVLASMAPLFWLFGVVLAAALGYLRKDLRGALIAGVAPLLALAPWLVRLIQTPGRLLTGIDPTAVPAAAAAPVLEALVGRDPGTTTPLALQAAVVGAVLIGGLLSAATTSARDRFQATSIAGLAILAPLMGVLLSRLVITIGGVSVRPGARIWVLVGLLACLVLVARRFAGIRLLESDQSKASRAQPVSAPEIARARVVAGLLGVAVLASAAWWLLGGTRGLTRHSGVLPGYVTSVQESSRASRALIIDVTPQRASYALSERSAPQWGSAEHNSLIADGRAVSEVGFIVQQVVDGLPTDDLAARAAKLGISHIWVRGSDPETIAALASVPGMVPSAGDASSTVWTIGGLPSRVMIGSGGGATVAVPEADVPRGGAERTLVIAEPADRQLWVSVDGDRLDQVDSADWRATFALGDRTGAVRWGVATSWLSMLWQLLAVAAMIVLAAPVVRSADQPLEVARRVRQEWVNPQEDKR